MSETSSEQPKTNPHGLGCTAVVIRDMGKPMYCLKCQSNEPPRFEQRGSWLAWRCRGCDALLDSDFEDDDICG